MRTKLTESEPEEDGTSDLENSPLPSSGGLDHI